jgi:hypothetical protein
LLRDTFLAMLVKEPAVYPEPEEDDASNVAHLHEPECITSTSPQVLPPQKAVLFCPLPVQVRHLKWWLTKLFADHLDIFYMYAEMCNDEHTAMHLKFQYLPSPSVFLTTPTVGGTGLNLTAPNHVVIPPKFWVLDEQRQAFTQVVQLGQKRVPHTWLLNTGHSGYDTRASDLHQLPGLAQMGVLHDLMSRPNITTSMIYRILECHENHMKHHTGQLDVVPLDGENE